MRDPFDKHIAGDKEKAQLNSSQELNCWRHSKTRARAEFFARQTDVDVEISSRTFRG